MARTRKPPGQPGVLDEIESQGGQLAEWVERHGRVLLAIVAGSLLAAAGYAGFRSWDERRENAASGALGAVQADYLTALGGNPGSLEPPKLANPDAAQAVHQEYLGRFRAVAEEHAGTAASTLASLQVAQLLSTQGQAEPALETLRQSLAGLSGNPGLRAIVWEHVAQIQEQAGHWSEAAEAYAAAGAVPEFALRYWALADAARCYASAGDPARALVIFDQIATEAPTFGLPAHLRDLARELRAASPS